MVVGNLRRVIYHFSEKQVRHFSIQRRKSQFCLKMAIGAMIMIILNVFLLFSIRNNNVYRNNCNCFLLKTEKISAAFRNLDDTGFESPKALNLKSFNSKSCTDKSIILFMHMF